MESPAPTLRDHRLKALKGKEVRVFLTKGTAMHGYLHDYDDSGLSVDGMFIERHAVATVQEDT